MTLFTAHYYIMTKSYLQELTATYVTLDFCSYLIGQTSTDIGTGYNVDVIKRFHEDFNLDKVDDKHRICSLLIDEMKIKSGLLYSRHTGNLTLFLNVILYFIFLTTVDFLHVLNYF